MRRSTLVLTAVGVSAAAITGSAFTASNTLPPTTAGYGASSVTGVVVDTIAYKALTGDATKLAEVDFTAHTAISTSLVATMTLKTGGDTGTVVGTPYTCKIGATGDTSSANIVCLTADNPRYDAFNDVGLSVTN